MLHQSSLEFLQQLKKNNTREWFEKNRKNYEAAKTNFAEVVIEIITQFGKKDVTIAALQAKDCVFRINRDVRFSKDKSPYKTNMGASFSKGGKKSISAGYYFHFEPGNSFIGGGLWMPDADSVKKVRQEIDYNFSEFKKIITSKKFIAQYNGVQITEETSLTREPKGYDKDNPAIDYIKLKSWLATTTLTNADLTDKSLTKKIVTAFEILQPFIDFLNSALEG